jgi:hypothetical protein
MGRWRRSRPRAGALAATVTGLMVLAVAAAGCTIRVRPQSTPTSVGSRPVAAATTTTAGPVTGGTTVASRAFTLVRNERGGRVRPAPAGPLPLALRRLGDDDDEAVNLVLVFPLLRARPPCVRQVELWLRLLHFGQQFRYQDPALAAYPSQLVSLATDHPASRIGWETLIDNRPSGTGSRTGDGNWMHFDITELYRTWAEGGPFSSLDKTIPRGTPLVVDVRATDFGQPLFEARVAPIGADRSTAPQLRWTAARDC